MKQSGKHSIRHQADQGSKTAKNQIENIAFIFSPQGQKHFFHHRYFLSFGEALGEVIPEFPSQKVCQNVSIIIPLKLKKV